MEKSYSASYAAAGVDITAGYKAVELMKKHIKRTKNEGCLDDVGGFGGCFGLPIAGMEEPVLVSGTDGCGTKVKLAMLMDVVEPGIDDKSIHHLRKFIHHIASSAFSLIGEREGSKHIRRRSLPQHCKHSICIIGYFSDGMIV